MRVRKCGNTERKESVLEDKSELLDVTNRYVNTQQRFMCVSRPRRFGKSMAADMLAAYYDCGDDTIVVQLSRQKSKLFIMN